MSAQSSVPVPPYDPLTIAAELIRLPSVTPADAGMLDALERWLRPLGFACERMMFREEGTPDIDNLYARIGNSGPHFCFAGHSDVVPPGHLDDWSAEPFGAELREGNLYGRGAADMKGAIAAFIAAASRAIQSPPFKDSISRGSISLLITGDEEGPSINGTRKMLEKLAARGERFDHCIVGEPTCTAELGDMIKVGRRGSINGWLTVHGTQGHVAYPHLADNPLPRLMEMLRRLDAHVLDRGNNHFQPSNFEITSIDTGNATTNIIPGAARAMMNIRFNDMQTGKGLDAWMRGIFDDVTREMGGRYDFQTQISGEAFFTEPGSFSAMVADAVRTVTGIAPELSTSGGTSDARFIRAYAPVVEFGLANRTMHKVDEHVPAADIARLADIYETVLSAYFAGQPA